VQEDRNASIVQFLTVLSVLMINFVEDVNQAMIFFQSLFKEIQLQKIPQETQLLKYWIQLLAQNAQFKTVIHVQPITYVDSAQKNMTLLEELV
jgi:hypothetical protein